VHLKERVPKRGKGKRLGAFFALVARRSRNLEPTHSKSRTGNSLDRSVPVGVQRKRGNSARR
jgi:hypothetical protein